MLGTQAGRTVSAVLAAAAKAAVEMEVVEKRSPVTDMTALEAIARRIADTVRQCAMTELLDRVGETLGATQPCPTCQADCRVVRHRRRLFTADGPVPYAEPACYCDACRRSFFPGPPAVAFG